MKKLLVGISLVVAVLCTCAPVMAEVVIDLYGLTEEQKAQLVLQAEQMKRSAAQPSLGEKIAQATDPHKVSEWVDLGKNMGLAVAAGAFVLAAIFGQLIFGRWDFILKPTIPNI